MLFFSEIDLIAIAESGEDWRDRRVDLTHKGNLVGWALIDIYATEAMTFG